MADSNRPPRNEGSTPDYDQPMTDDGSPPPRKMIHIETKDLPRPAWPFQKEVFPKLLLTRILHAQAILRRDVTQEETSAMAYHTAKFVRIAAWGKPIGVAAGLWRAWVGRKTFTLPFYKVKAEKWDVMRFPPRLGWIKGANAVFANHMLRALAYGTLGKWLGAFAASSYALTVMEVGLSSDGRLKAYNAAKRDLSSDGRLRASLNEAIKDRKTKPAGLIMGDQSLRNAQEQENDQFGQRTYGQVESDDASPSGGGYGDEYESSFQSDVDAQKQASDAFKRAPTSPPTRGRTVGPKQVQPAPTTRPSSEPSSEPFSMFDDASPTGGQGMGNDVDKRAGEEASTSAWDRLRKGGRPSASLGNREGEQPRPRTKATDSNMESFTFSDTDAERAYAKDEAQKEFDARIEQERMGKNFGGPRSR